MILTSWPRLIVFLSFILVLTVLSIPNDSKMGIIYFKSYEYDKALTYFDRAKTNDSESPIILKKIKDYFIIQGDIKKALISQKKLTKLLPKNISYWQELVKLYNWNNMPYQSLKAEEEIVKLVPTKQKDILLLKIQQGYQWLRKWDDATAIGIELYKSDSPKILEQNLQYFLMVQNTGYVIKHIEKLEKLTQDTTSYKNYLAQAFILNKEYKKAILNLLIAFGEDNRYKDFYQSADFLDKPYSYIKKHEQILEQIIDLYEKLNDNLSVAKIYAKLYTLDSSRYDSALDAADIFVKHHLYSQAKRILKKIYKVRSASRVFRAAHIYLEMKDKDQAIKYMEKAIDLYPYKADYYNDLTSLYEEKGQKRKALQLQLKLLKLLKKNKSSSHYFINPSEVLFSFNANTLPRIPANENDQIKSTRNKIIQLMEELGETEQKHKQLLELSKENPSDTEAKIMLAFSFLEKGDYPKAQSLFKEIYKANPYNKEAAIFIADDYLQNTQVDLAFATLKPFIESKDIEIQSRLFSIYRIKNPKKAKQICSTYQVSNIRDFSQVELQVKCHEYQENYSDNINLLLSYLSYRPNNNYAKALLAYQFLHQKELEKAKKIINDLKEENSNPLLLQDLNIRMQEVITNLKIEKSWEHTLNFNYYDAGSYYFWSNTFELYRNTGKLSYGVRLLNAEPAHTDKRIGYNSALIKYHFNDDIISSVYFGNNFGHSDKAVYGLSFDYQWLEKLNISYTADIATQIYTIPAFSVAKEALRNSHALYLNYDHNFRNRFAFSLGHNHYYLDSLYVKSRFASAQYNYFLTSHWSPGIFIQNIDAYEGDQELESLIISKSSVEAINLKHEYIFYKRKMRNTVNFYIGRDQAREIKFGNYLNFRETFSYDHSKRKQANLTIEWSKASQNINVGEYISIQLGYNFWFL